MGCDIDYETVAIIGTLLSRLFAAIWVFRVGICDRTRIIRRLNNGQISVQRVKVLSKIIFFAIYTYISTMTRKKRCENDWKFPFESNPSLPRVSATVHDS